MVEHSVYLLADKQSPPTIPKFTSQDSQINLRKTKLKHPILFAPNQRVHLRKYYAPS